MIKYIKTKKKGITLIEFLAVIAILLILFSVMLPAISRVRDNSRTVLCISNIKQLSVAALQYALDYEHLPASLYENDITAYYDDEYNLRYCPEDDRDLSPTGTVRGSYGLNNVASNFSAYDENVPLLADSNKEDLTVSTFQTRHKRNKKGNVAYLDGHVEQVTASDFSM